MRDLELARWIGRAGAQSAATEAGRTRTYAGVALADSADGYVLVDMGGDNVSADGGQGLEIPCSPSVKQGDRVVVTVVNGSPSVTSVYGWGDYVGAQAAYASAYVGDLGARQVTADKLQAATAYVGELQAGNVTAGNVTAASGFFTALEARSIDADALAATHAYIDELSADGITTGQIEAAAGYVGTLLAGDVTASKLVSASGEFGDLTATNAYIGALKAKDVTAEDLFSSAAFFGTVEAGGVTARNIVADHEKVNGLESTFATIDNLTATNEKVANLEADHVSANDFTAATGKIAALEAATADLGDVRADSAKVHDLTADELRATVAAVGDLDAHYAQIDLANVTNAWIENGVVKDAAISSAQIAGVSANKITAGTINGSVINVTNLNADNITTGTINGQRIGDGSLSLDKLSEDVYTQGQVDAIVDGLNSRIDAQIETWTATEVPTLSNYPAGSWGTADARAEHVGDICYVLNAASEADGYTYRFAYDNASKAYSWVLIKDNQVTAALQRLVDAEGDISGLQSFESEIGTWKTATDTEIGTIKGSHTTLETKVNKTLVSTVQLWYSKANTTAPDKPKSQVTSTSTAGNAWRTVVPAYSATYPNYFYCYQWEYADGTFGWSSVTRDIAMGEAQSTARTASSTASTAKSTADTAKTTADAAASDAATAKSTADTAAADAATAKSDASTAKTDAATAKSDASSAVTTANAAASDAADAKTDAADAKSDAATAKSDASTAKTDAATAKSTAATANTTANTAKSTADTAKTTADTAKSTADTAKSTADAANSTANTAKSTADTAKAEADANIKSSVQLWFTKANTTKPSKPTAHVTTNDAAKGNAWNLAVPTYSASYPHYYYCWEYQKGDGSYSWSDVVYDAATSENQKNARDALTQVATKVETSTFNEVKQAVDENSATITQLTTIVENNGLTESTTVVNTVNEVRQTATSNSSKISGLETIATNNGLTSSTNITQRTSAIEQDLGGITTKVTKLETDTGDMGKRLTSAETTVKQNSDSITSQASQISGLQSDMTTLKQTASGLSVTVSSMRVGGRNLAVESTAADGYLLYPDGTDFADAAHRRTQLFPVEPGATYTLTAYKAAGDGEYLTLHWYDASGASVGRATDTDGGTIKSGWAAGDSWSHVCPANAAQARLAYPASLSKAVKLERGTLATDWTPAPEDVEDASRNAQETANEAGSAASRAADLAGAAQATADGAQSAANVAQETADGARDAAQLATKAAEDAASDAAAAQTSADAAQQTADAASDAAGSAMARAEEVKGEAADYTDDAVAAEAKQREDAMSVLESRLDVEAGRIAFLTEQNGDLRDWIDYSGSVLSIGKGESSVHSEFSNSALSFVVGGTYSEGGGWSGGTVAGSFGTDGDGAASLMSSNIVAQRIRMGDYAWVPTNGGANMTLMYVGGDE